MAGPLKNNFFAASLSKVDICRVYMVPTAIKNYIENLEIIDRELFLIRYCNEFYTRGVDNPLLTSSA